MGLFKNISGLFVGQNSKKRQIGMTAGVILVLLQNFGIIDPETFKLLMILVGSFTGYAFSAKLTKIANSK